VKNNWITYLIASVWFINGFYCKVLNQVPRHEQIVGSIIGFNYARELTFSIGLSEIIMTLWILSKYKTRLNTITQIFIIGLMNILEFLLVPDLLLWGKLNIVFALGLIIIIYINEFHLNNKKYV